MKETVEYEIKLSNRKTIAIEAKKGRLIVRAPFFTSKKAIEDFVDKNSEWIKKHIAKTQNEENKISSITDEQLKMLKKRAKVILTEKAEKFSAIMGVTPAKIKINSARTRFGSCNGKNEINFSCYLMLYPQKAIDFVVMHELAHIKHHDHSEQFHNFLQKYCPDEKECKKLLVPENIQLPDWAQI